MKGKSPNMEKLKKMIRKIHEHPKMMKMAKDFVAHLGSKA